MNFIKIATLLGLHLSRVRSQASSPEVVLVEHADDSGIMPHPSPQASRTRELQCESGHKPTTRSLTETLREGYLKYNGIKLPFEDGTIPFSDLYTHLELRRRSGLIAAETSQPLSFWALGDRVDLKTGKPIRHTWIEGAAGTGKTTLVKHMLYSWASAALRTSVQQIRPTPFLANYKTILYLPLRHILRLFEKRDEPYRYSDFLKKSQQWQRWVLMNRGGLLDDDDIHELELLFREYPEEILLIVDGLDEVDPNHPLLRDFLLNPNQGHHFIVTTRPQKIPTWLESHIDREIVVEGFDDAARKSYISKYYERLQKRGHNITQKEEGLKQWLKNHAHMDAFMAIPLNCHLICVISSQGILPTDPTNTNLYDLMLIQWIKRALTKSASMRLAYGIEAITEFDILTAIREQYSEQELLIKSQGWILNLEEIAFACIQEGDSITVSGNKIASVIEAQDPEISHKKLMERIQELIFFGILSPRGISEDKLTEIYEYTHKTFLEYMGGRCIAGHLAALNASVNEVYNDPIKQLFFSPENNYGFYQPRLSLVLRFTTGAINRLLKEEEKSEEILFAWINELLRAYQKSFWGSGALLQVFSVLVEIDQNYIMPKKYVSYCRTAVQWLFNSISPGTYSENSFSQIDNDYKDTAPITDINSLKIAIMRMLWGYAKAEIVIKKSGYVFDGNLARLWRMACLQIDASSKQRGAYTRLKQRIQFDSEQADCLVLKHQAIKAIEIMGSTPVEFEPTNHIVPFVMPGEEMWVQKCLTLHAYQLDVDLTKYVMLRKLIRLFDKIDLEADSNLHPFVSQQSIRTFIQLLAQSVSQSQTGYSHQATRSLNKLLLLPNLTLSDEEKMLVIDPLISKLNSRPLNPSHRRGMCESLSNLDPFIGTLKPRQQAYILESLLSSDSLNTRDYTVFQYFRGLHNLAPIIMTLEKEKQIKILDKLVYLFDESDNGKVMSKVVSMLGNLCSKELMPQLNALEGNYTSKVNHIIFRQIDREDTTNSEQSSAITALIQLLSAIDPIDPDEQVVLIDTLMNRTLFRDETDSIRKNAERTMGNLLRVIDKFQPALREKLIDFRIKRIANLTEDEEVRRRSVNYFEDLSPIMDHIEPNLQRLIISTLTNIIDNTTELESLRWTSINIIGNLAPSIRSFTPKQQLVILHTLINKLEDTDPTVRSRAITSIGKLMAAMTILDASHQMSVCDTLINSLPDNDASVGSAVKDVFITLKSIIMTWGEQARRHIHQKMMVERAGNFNILSYISEISREALSINFDWDFSLEQQESLADLLLNQFNIVGQHDQYEPHKNIQHFAPLIPFLNQDLQEQIIQSMVLHIFSYMISNFDTHYALSVEAVTPVIHEFDEDSQQRIVSAILGIFNKDPGDVSLNQAIEAVEHITDPFDPEDVNHTHFLLVKPLLLVGLRLQKHQTQLTVDHLFNFTRKPKGAEVAPISFEVLKARIQWLIIVSHYPAFCFQVQAKYELINLQPRLRYFLQLDTVLKRNFDPSMASSTLKLFLLGWQLPNTIQGSTDRDFQAIGEPEVRSSQVSVYAQKFNEMQPKSVQQGSNLLAEYLENGGGVSNQILDGMFVLLFFMLVLCVRCVRRIPGVAKSPALKDNPELETKGSMKHRVGAESTRGYMRHPVAADGDCGYTAFGITRDEALSQLLGHIEPVKELLQPAIREALLTDRFYRYLIANNVIRSEVTHENIVQTLEEHLSLTAVYQSYLTYDVRDKHIDAGYAHPGVLQALAHIRGISLRMWRLGENAELSPNRGSGFDYFEYISPNEEDPRSVDILFVNNNHFELLESSELNEKVSEGDMPTCPLNSSWTQTKEEPSITTTQSLPVREFRIPSRDITRGNRLGSGSFSTVFHSTWQSTDVAEKVLENQGIEGEALSELEREAETMLRLSHPNIIQLFGVCLEAGHFALVLEYMPAGSLQSILSSNGRELFEPERMHISSEMVKGMRYLHDRGILHRDFKSSNVLLGNNGEVKIADFGLAGVRSDTIDGEQRNAGNRAGTPAFMAPEILRYEGHTISSDTYSLAIVFWQMIYRQEPWSDLRLREVITFTVAIQKQRPPTPKRSDVSSSYLTLIRSCWAEIPETRLALSDVLAELGVIRDNEGFNP